MLFKFFYFIFFFKREFDQLYRRWFSVTFSLRSTINNGKKRVVWLATRRTRPAWAAVKETSPFQLWDYCVLNRAWLLRMTDRYSTGVVRGQLSIRTAGLFRQQTSFFLFLNTKPVLFYILKIHPSGYGWLKHITVYATSASSYTRDSWPTAPLFKGYWLWFLTIMFSQCQ